MALQSKGGQEFKKNKPLNATKAGSQTPTKFLICCFVTIKVQRSFVELHVALL
jgi:hypothetical protein